MTRRDGFLIWFSCLLRTVGASAIFQQQNHLWARGGETQRNHLSAGEDKMWQWQSDRQPNELLMVALFYRTKNVCSPERPRISPSWRRWRKRSAVTLILSRRLESWGHYRSQISNLQNKSQFQLLKGINSQTKRHGRHWKGGNSACCTMLERFHTLLLVS